MRKRIIKPIAVCLALLSILIFSLPACSGYGDLCQKQTDCEGGNDKDVDACVEGAEGAEDIADAYDCGDEFGKLADCTKEKSTCTNGNFTASNACSAEATAYSACQKAATGKK